MLELKAIRLTLLHLKQEIFSQTVLIESANMATVSYVNKKRGVVSNTLNDEVCTLYEWVTPRSLKLQAVHRPGIKNELAVYLSRNRPDPTEWHLSLLIAQCPFQVWGRPQVDLFASHQNHQFPLWFCQTGHPLAAASNVLSNHGQGCTSTPILPVPSPPIAFLKRTLIKIREDQVEEAIIITPNWPRRSWYHLRLQMVCEIPLLLPCRWNLLSQHLPTKGVLRDSS